MQRVFFILFFSTIFCLVKAQQRLPVFATKADSAAYEDVNQMLNKALQNPRYTFRIDSLMKASSALRERAMRFRTVYRPSAQFTRYEALPADLGSVTRLSISKYNGKSLPDSIYMLANLTELELVNTRIKKLPRKLANLRSLKRVTLLNNRPPGRLRLGRNDKVETLTIHDDEFNKLPGKYRKTSNLKTLDLARCGLTAIPNVKGNKALLRLVLSDNRISLENPKQQLPNLEDLVLTSNAIRSIPPGISNFPGLKKLNLNQNQVESIAPEIIKLQKLEQLNLYKNNLRSIPAPVYELSNLRVIDLYYNQIEQLDSAVAKLSKLEILYVANNKLFSVPNSIGRLSNLRELYLHHNRISTLPETLSGLDSLRILRVNNNLLLELPQSIYTLTNLENLDISENQIHVIPLALFEFPKLKVLALTNNPWDPTTRQSILSWAEAATKRNVIVHLEGLTETGTR